MKEGLTVAASSALERFLEGQRLGLARAISLVEDEREGFEELLHAVLTRGLRAARTGVTGPPGAGKSSLVAAMAHRYREADERIGVVAVDPTSPYSGGALLGDRIRMNDLATDPGIFIRSMATRGSLGGLATTTREVIDLMDAFGFQRVLIETVGVGQSELEITGAADTVVVVLVPESGDGIQAMKAGLMEIADVFVINKADRPGADRLVKEIRQSIHLRGGGEGPRSADAGHHGPAPRRAERGPGPGGSGAASGPARSATRERRTDEPKGKPPRWEPPEGWRIPVLKTVAQTGEGVEELMEAVAAHRTHLLESGELQKRRRARAERRVRDVVERALVRRAWSDPGSVERLRSGVEAIARDEDTPYSVARRIVGELLRVPGS
ncbi:MAG: methylmalonyl Co-A mutase-associated GTPase MeaB [Gemmatimonadota bacterium]